MPKATKSHVYKNVHEHFPDQDGGVEGYVLISSCKSTKVANSCWIIINRRTLEHTKKNDTSCPKTKKKLQQDRREALSWFNQIPYLPGRWLTDWKTGEQQYQSHNLKCSEPHIRLLSLGTWQRDWESPGNLALRVSRVWLQAFQRTEGNRDSRLGGHKQNFSWTKTQRRGVVPHRRQNQNYLLILNASCGSMGWQGLTMGYGHWKVPVGINPLGVHH